jgi:type I restriction enzyme S subunit
MMLMRAAVSGRYLMHVLNSPSTLAMVAKLTGGSASPHLNVGDVKAFPIPFPPCDEQLLIVQEIERRTSVIDEVELQLYANLKRAARLRQGILKRAFEGLLVPQDQSDEHAEKLLERIRQPQHATTGARNGSPRTRQRGRRRDGGSTLPMFPEGGFDGD